LPNSASRDREWIVPGAVGIGIDPQGNIYVADTWNLRIQKFDSNLTYLAQWAVQGWDTQTVVNKPYLAVDPDGNIAVTDPEGARGDPVL